MTPAARAAGVERAAAAWWSRLDEGEQRRRQMEGGTVAELWLAARISNAELCLADLADMAGRVDRELAFVPVPLDGNDLELVDLLFSRIRDALRSIGCLADIAADHLRGRPSPHRVKESAADWLVCPIFDRDVAASVSAGSAEGGAA